MSFQIALSCKAEALCLQVIIPNFYPFNWQDTIFRLLFKSWSRAKLVSLSRFLPSKQSTSQLTCILHMHHLSELSPPWISFCNGGEESAISPFASRITHDLGPFLLSASEDTLSLVLETIAVVLEVDEGKWLTVDLAASLVNAALQVWNGNNKGEFLHYPTPFSTNLPFSFVLR